MRAADITVTAWHGVVVLAPYIRVAVGVIALVSLIAVCPGAVHHRNTPSQYTHTR